jgi:iron complex outermembrane receptor protein
MNRTSLLVVILGWNGLATAQTPISITEKDFLTDMPVVLSVSRLPQRLDETPGAVTLIDRDMIRLSGARDVADLLRLVPGFQTSMAFEMVGPQASYHGAFGGLSNRIQVLVDGRTVYSPYFIGSVEGGLQTVALEDVERIEVLRGSNSAAYGARAFLGVVNIVTRDSADTVGTEVLLRGGENGIRDAQARVGWGSESATFRLGMDRRADDGLQGSNGHNRVDRINFRADLRPNATDEVQLRAGTLGITAGKGFAGNIDDPTRDVRYGSGHVQIDWRRALSADQDVAFAYSHTEESYQDKFPYSLAELGINDNIDIDVSGRSSTDNLSLQHTWRQSPSLRLVWGGELRRERVTSMPVYNTDAALVTDFTRLFGNLEWRPATDLVLNVGALAERSSVDGGSVSPRLMLNWHVADGHTLRLGGSGANRPPSTYEKSADVRHYWNGHLLAITTQSSGTVKPETVSSSEIGYMGVFPSFGFNLDVRAFNERIKGFIRQFNASQPKDYFNQDDFSLQGLEYEMKLQAWAGAQFRLGQAYIHSSMVDQGMHTDSGMTLAAPKLTSTIAYVQKLPGGLDFTLLHQDSSTMTLQGAGRDDQFAFTRTDLRLAAPLRFGRTRGEVALVLQNLASPYPDYSPGFAFQRRAFVTLQIEN